jgi:hypothetical protein
VHDGDQPRRADQPRPVVPAGLEQDDARAGIGQATCHDTAGGAGTHDHVVSAAHALVPSPE